VSQNKNISRLTQHGMALAVALVLGAAWSAALRADTLSQGETLNCGDRLWADNNIYNLSCKDLGSNQYALVLSTGTTIVYWDSYYEDAGYIAGYGDHEGQIGWAGPDSYASMQMDGNFVLYDDGTYGGGAKWATNTDYSGAEIVNMQNDGNLVLYNHYNVPLWSIF
jgi:hypothetical protein